MTVLVTGATGFLGSALCRALVARGVAVRATARALPEGWREAAIDWRCVDLAGAADWPALVDGVDTVYHLAWSSIPATAAAAPVQDLSINVGGVIGLLEAARSRPGIRIVFPSSGGTVYGRSERLPLGETDATRPLNAYGVAKLTAEAYLDLYRSCSGVNSIALRIANPFGFGQDPGKGLGAVTHFARAAFAGEPLVLFGDGSAIRDFIEIDDVVEAMILAGERRDVVGPLNIGTGSGRSLREVIGLLERYFGRPLPVSVRPARPFDIQACVLDVSAARERLGWSPRYGFEEALTRLLDKMATA